MFNLNTCLKYFQTTACRSLLNKLIVHAKQSDYQIVMLTCEGFLHIYGKREFSYGR